MAKKIDHSRLTDLALGNLAPDEALKLLDELSNDHQASKRLDEIAELAQFIDEHGDEVFRLHPGEKSEGIRAWSGVWEIVRSLVKAPAFAYVAVVVVILIVGGGVVLTSRVVSGPYEEMARVGDEIPEYAVRGPGNQDMAEAMQLIEEGNYAGTIKLCDRYMRIHPQEESVAYASYVAGLASLLSARHTVAGLFPSYDHDPVLKGIAYLSTAEKLSPNARVREEAMWLHAKGFLMLGQSQAAREELERVRVLQGPRSGKALDLLKRIEATSG